MAIQFQALIEATEKKLTEILTLMGYGDFSSVEEKINYALDELNSDPQVERILQLLEVASLNDYRVFLQQASSFERKEDVIKKLITELDKGLKEQKCNNTDDLAKKVDSLKKQMLNSDDEEIRASFIKKIRYLNQLLLTPDKIALLQKPDPQQIAIEISVLQADLEKGLAQQKLKSVSDIPKKIEQLSKQWTDCDDDELKALISQKLEQLNRLLLIPDKIKELQKPDPEQLATQIKSLQTDLEKGLAKHKMKSAEELPKKLEQLNKQFIDCDDDELKELINQKLLQLIQLQAIQKEIQGLMLEKPASQQQVVEEVNASSLVVEQNKSLEKPIVPNQPASQHPGDAISLVPASPVADNQEAVANQQPIVDEGKALPVSHQEDPQILLEKLERLNTVPDCAERSAGILLACVQLKKLNVISPKFNLDELLKAEMLALQQQVKLEGHTSIALKEYLAQAEQAVQTENWQFAESRLVKLQQILQPFDADEMFRLAKKTDVAVKHLHGKDIILLLGGTGAGKSTTIHFLAGSEMEEQDVHGLKHIGPKVVKNKALKDVICSPFARSETVHVSAIPLNLQELGSTKEGTIILCDTPGFGETRGPEQDFSNALGLVKAVRSCKTARPLVLLSEPSIGTKSQGIRDLAHTVIRMVPKLEDYIHCFAFAFTRFRNPLTRFGNSLREQEEFFAEKKEELHARLQNVKKLLSSAELTDAGFVKFLDVLIEQTDYIKLVKKLPPIGNAKPNKLYIHETNNGLWCAMIDPAAESFQKFKLNEAQLGQHVANIRAKISTNKALDTAEKAAILKQALDNDYNLMLDFIDPIRSQTGAFLDHVMNVEPINNPAEVFHMATSDASNAALKQQLECYRASILAALKRFDYKLINYKLDQMKTLREALAALKDSSIGDQYEFCIKEVSDNINQIYNQATENFNATLAAKNNLTDVDFKRYRQAIELLKNAAILRDTHLGKELVESGAMLLNVEAQSERLLFLAANKIAEQEFNNAELSIYLGNLKRLAEEFAEGKTAYSKAKELIINKLKELAEEAEKLMNRNSFDGFAIAMSKLKEGVDSLHAHMEDKNKTEFSALYHSLSAALLKYLESQVTALGPLFNKPLDSDTIEKVQACDALFEAAKADFLLRTHVPIESVKALHETLVSKISVLFKQKAAQVTQLFSAGDLRQAFEQSREPIEQMSLLRELPTINSADFSRSYYDALDTVISCVREIKREVEKMLEASSSDKEGENVLNYAKLVRLSAALSEAEWVNKYSAGSYSYILKQVESLFEQHIAELHEVIDSLPLGLDNPENLKQASQTVMPFRKSQLAQLSASVPKLKAVCDNLAKAFEDRVTTTLEKIRADFEASFDARKAEKAYPYLVACANLLSFGALSQKAADILSKIKEQAFVRSGQITKKIEAAFGEIVQGNQSNNSSALNKLVQEVADCSHELLNSLNKKPDEIFECFAQAKESCIVKFKSQYKQLSEEMEEYGVQKQDVKLVEKVKVVKALCFLDSLYFAEDKSISYTSLYSEYKNPLGDFDDVIKNNIKQHNYKEVAAAMSVLSESKDKHVNLKYKKMQGILSDIVQASMDDTQDMLNRLSPSLQEADVKALVIALRQLTSARASLQPYLHEQVKADLTVLVQEKAKKAISDKVLASLKMIAKMLKAAKDFSQAEAKWEAISQVCKVLLQPYLSADAQKEIQGLDEQVANIFMEQVKYYQGDWNNYVFNPPKAIIEKLEQTGGYEANADTLKKAILKKFEQEIADIRKLSDINRSISKLKSLRDYLSYLTPQLSAAVSRLLDKNIAQSENLASTFEKDLEQHIKQDDIASIRQLYTAKEKEGDYYVGKIKSRVLEQVAHLYKQVQDILSKTLSNSDGEALSAVIGLLFDYQTQFNKEFPEIVKVYTDVVKRIGEVLKIRLGLLNQSINQTAQANSNIANNAKENLGLLLAWKQAIENKAFAKHIFPANFVADLKQCSAKLSDTFNVAYKNYMQALQVIDIAKIKENLNFMASWELVRSELGQTSPVIVPYADCAQKLVVEAQKWAQAVANCSLINEETKQHEKKREQFYQGLLAKLDAIKQAKLLLSEHNANPKWSQSLDMVLQNCQQSLKVNMESILTNVQQLIGRGAALTPAGFAEFNHAYNNLLAFEKYISPMSGIPCKGTSELKNKFIERAQNYAEKIKANAQTPVVVAENLIAIKQMTDQVLVLKDPINDIIDEALALYKVAHGVNAFNAVKVLGTVLRTTPVGLQIIAEHAVLKGQAMASDAEKRRKHGIDYVLKNIAADDADLDVDMLKIRYSEFDRRYHDLVDSHLKPGDLRLPELIANLELFVSKLPTQEQPDFITWDAKIKNAVPEIMAYIFALWTLKNARYYFEAQGDQNQDHYLLRPHPAQVISIFRMLGIGYSQSIGSWFVSGFKSVFYQSKKQPELMNNLVQIGTGEGKSVTLAVTGAVLGLLGCDVMCACYSDYLSKRDFNDFQWLFKELSIGDQIHYGTFNQLCERVINEDGNVRDVVQNMVCSKVGAASVQQLTVKRPKVLLIDEVDVFFSKDFYGNTYSPGTTLRHPSILKLANLIWSQRKEHPHTSFTKVMASAEYQDCRKAFPGWEFIVEEAVKDMLADVRTFQSHDYVVKNDRIGYKEQDEISYNITCGYKTLFAYYHECEQKAISQKSLEENVGISISCGNFSYADIPHEFQCIMGVTGTLKQLSEPEKKVIREVYGIQKNTYSPSVFGANQRVFYPDKGTGIKIENSDDYFKVIAREIDDNLQAGKRAVLVFFESKQKLKEFYDSQVFAPRRFISDYVTVMTEELNAVEKDSCVKKATRPGQITLATRVFGRGTDFICRDDSVERNGGVHVIQTFLSEELSEEVQIQGRTARQGDHGSYSMALLDTELEKFGITLADIAKMGKGCYDELNEKRNAYFKLQYNNNNKHVDDIKKQHRKAKEFLGAVLENQPKSAAEFLKEWNKGAPVPKPAAKPSRTLCLMDATGSMSHLLQNAKNTVGTMFERAAIVLKNNSIEPNLFQLQFAVYRNYNSPAEDILEASPWESRPDNLRNFMNRIGPKGGWGAEAVEIGLLHANQELEKGDVSQVILIGDAPANPVGEVAKLRGHKGESYWSSKAKFAKPTNYLNEVNILKTKKVPVHTFFVADWAKANFDEIAKATGGRCEELNVNSPDGAECLTNLVTMTVLKDIGDRTGDAAKGEQLQKEYEARFIKKSYQ